MVWTWGLCAKQWAVIERDTMKKLGFVGVACAVLTGCSIAPSVNVVGAYFPGWLFCIVAGVSLTVIVHLIQSRRNLGAWLAPMAVTYPVLTTLFSLCVWLIFF